MGFFKEMTENLIGDFLNVERIFSKISLEMLETHIVLRQRESKKFSQFLLLDSLKMALGKGTY